MKTIWITILTLVISACNNKKQQVSDKNMPGMKMDTKEKRTSMENMAGMDSNVYYTCSMHPQVMESKPGKCPICGMKLIAIQKNNTPNAEELKLSDQQVQLGNIQTDTISSSMLGDETILTATLNIDQKKTTSISARVMGRIEKLYFKNTGDYVKEGARLYDLYSEDLNNAKQELILAIEQIEELVKTKKTTPITAYYSNVSGYITTIELKEGDYTMEGSTIIKLADLSTVWAEAQVYSSQLSNIDVRGMAEVQIPGMPGRKMEGKIEFVNPEINPDTRINLVRLSILNPGNQLKPGMPAYVILNNRKHSTISLPIAAVIRDGISANVWLQTGTNTFKSKMVEVGMETGNRIEIKSGLKAGDIIVTSGAYLINSEYIFKNGASPMAGMKM
jgi:Cu(I)/Ag(I) efflux system membrane fusion protein